MIEQNNKRLPVFIFLHKDVARVRIAMDVTEFEDHLGVHLADLGGDVVRIDPIGAEVVRIVDVPACCIK